MTETVKTAVSAKGRPASELARYIDHSILKPDTTIAEIRDLTQIGIDRGVATICVNPAGLDAIAPMLEGTGIGISVVCDFPFGQGTAADKEMLARNYCMRGDVTDLDLVINYGLIKEGKWKEAAADIQGAIDVCREHGVVSKVIIETDALTDEQIADACEAVISTGADYVKTSTGFYAGGPTEGGSVEVMKKIISIVDGRAKVKASAHIRTREHFLALIDLGVDRIGLSFSSTPLVLDPNAGAADGEASSGY